MDSCRNRRFLSGLLLVVCVAAASQIAAFAKKPAPAVCCCRRSNPIAAARSLSMELLLPVWRAPPAVTAAAVMGPLAMQRLRLMCRLGFTLPAPSSPSLSLGKMTTRLHDWVGSVRVSSLGEDGSWLVDVGRQFEKVDEVDGGTGSKCRHRGRVVQCVGLKQHCGSHCRTVYELC